MSDIRPFGTNDGLGFFWIRKVSGFGGRQMYGQLHLVAIDELGNVTDTGNRRPDDEAAGDEGDAVREHLSAGIKEANARLERRRAELAENPPPPAPDPISPATEAFLYDGD